MSLAAAAALIVRRAYWTPTVKNINCHRGGGGDAVEAIHRGGDVGGDDHNNTNRDPIYKIPKFSLTSSGVCPEYILISDIKIS